jgi:hypothetical protein
MKKVTRRIAEAFKAGKRLTVGNTSTDGERVYLHGNLIVERQKDGKIYGTLAGWPTVTTRERLNGICQVIDSPIGFYQKKWEQYVSCFTVDQIDGDWKRTELTPDYLICSTDRILLNP